MKIKYIIYAIVVCLLAFLIVKRLTKPSEDKMKGNTGKPGEAPPVSVRGIVTAKEDFSNSINISGSLEANEQVMLRPEISGLVKSINFSEGSYVNQGAILVKIDDSELRAQLSQAVTKQNLAAQVANRAAKLFKAEAISQEELDNAIAELKSQQAQSQLIKAQINKTVIVAPFSGKIGLRNISKGAYVTPSTDIANLVNLSPIKISFSVPEKYAQMVKTGKKINFTTAGNNKVYDAIIFAIEPSVTTGTRTLLLKARCNNTDGSLLPGTYANVILPLENIKNAILIPTEAVIPVMKGKQVYVSKNGVAEPISIQSDFRTDDKIVVTSGLLVGDTVITSGVMALKPGSAVKVKVGPKR